MWEEGVIKRCYTCGMICREKTRASDRTIAEYEAEIWKLGACLVP